MRTTPHRMRWHVGAAVVFASLASAAASGSCGSTAADEGTPVLPPVVDAAAEDAAPGCERPYPTPKNTPLSILSTMPDVSFTGYDENGSAATFALHDEFEPCAARSRLLVFRVGALWCGTCDWHWSHSKELFGGELADRIRTLDLLVANEDNAPAVLPDLARFKTRIDRPTRIGLDPKYVFGPIVDGGGGPLPLYVFIDSRTMKIVNYKNDPDPETLAFTIATEIAVLDKTARPKAPPPDFIDGFSRNQRDLIAGMGFPAAAPPDPGNAFGDDPKAAALGKKLFSDPLLSPTGTVSCATCHVPEAGFADGKPQAVGTAKGDRNTPSILFTAWQRWQFWDGRADSLWTQALGPFENAREFDSSRLHVVHQIAARYKVEYEDVFPNYPLPDLTDTLRFPLAGKPGQPAWDGMAAADKELATRIYVNVGKAIAAFERSLKVKPNRFDQYVAGNKEALTKEEKGGLQSFFLLGCAQCHFGPRLTNDAFHNARFATGRVDLKPDHGRSDVLGVTPEFSRASAFADPIGFAPPQPPAPPGGMPPPFALGAFKTPTLRGVAKTAPYGHGGSLLTLDDVAHHYGTRGLLAGDPTTIGETEPWMPAFDHHAGLAVVPFMMALEAELETP